MTYYIQCRLCAEWKFNNELINIKKEEAIKINLESKIQQCLHLNFQNTQLPSNVCLLCCDKVGSTFEFQELVKKAQLCLVEVTENEPYNYVETVLTDYENDKILKQEVPEITHFEESNDIAASEDQSIEDYRAVYVKQEAEERIEEIAEQNLETDIVEKCEYKRKLKDGQAVNNNISSTLAPEYEKRKYEKRELIRRVKAEWKQYKWKCILCEIECTSLADFRNHFTNNHNQAPKYSCRECSKIYDSHATFKRHVATHRNKYKFQCQICSRYFHQKNDYENHLETHSPEKKYKCSKCDKTYQTPDCLRRHLRTHLPKTKTKPKAKFCCDLCNKHLATKASLVIHKKMHVGKKDFTCDQCGKAFLISTSLKYHLKSVHSDLKPFCCEHCQRTFKTQQLLKTHLLVHNDEKHHVCEVCGQRFHRKGTLKRHASVHTGVLAFECQHCHKAFRTKQFLQVHLRQHTGERPYSCQQCNRHFTDSSNYFKHMKGTHGVLSTRINVTYKADPPEQQKLEK